MVCREMELKQILLVVHSITSIDRSNRHERSRLGTECHWIPLAFCPRETMTTENVSVASSQVSETPPTLPESVHTGDVPLRLRNALSALRLFAILLILALFSTFLTVVPVGERGVLLQLGRVRNNVLDEGIHIIIPIIQSVKTLNIRIQSCLQESEAATKDLQDVSIDLAVLWHIPPKQVPRVYQSIGAIGTIERTILIPSIENTLKTVVAGMTAEELITQRPTLLEKLDVILRERLSKFDLALDGIDLVQIDFSSRFRAAVEAKQVAEQDARRAAYEAVRAQRQAAARVYLAEGEAKAQELLQAGLNTKVLQRQAIEKWDGHMPLVVGNDSNHLIDIKALFKADRERQRH